MAKTSNKFQGAFTALVTPFKNGKVDFSSLEKLIESQIQGGISGLVPCGTTGESPTLSDMEKKEIIKFTAEKSNKRITVIAGTGSNDTQHTIELTAFAKEIGADAALIVVPYYNKPTPEGLFKHFSKIAEEIDIPIVIYNIPGRSVVSLTIDTIIALSKLSDFVAIKEASGNLNFVSEIIQNTSISVLSGDDSLTLPILSLGGKGVISVVSNIFPRQMEELVTSYLSGDTEKSRTIHFQLFPLMKALFVETNPAPVKEAMKHLGIIETELRLPLVPVLDKNKKIIVDALTNCSFK
ncbi:MAG: 4-hydroxy-tetrahydrodipicolinate synthase [Planctomycetota bacterium]